MDLWIRSQDRECIMKVARLDIDGKKISANGFYTILGEYKSYERALEVLDEIQKKIVLLGLGNNFGSPMIDLDNPFNIYIMPKE